MEVKQLHSVLRFFNLLEIGQNKLSLSNILVYTAIILSLITFINRPPVEMISFVLSIDLIAVFNYAWKRFDERKQLEVKVLKDTINSSVEQLKGELTESIDARLVGLQQEIGNVKTTAELFAKRLNGKPSGVL